LDNHRNCEMFFAYRWQQQCSIQLLFVVTSSKLLLYSQGYNTLPTHRYLFNNQLNNQQILMSMLSRLSLYPANPEQTLESRKHSFHDWGRGNSLEEYLERDEKTERHEVAWDDRFITWILAPRESRNSLNFLCSCETCVYTAG